MTMDNTKPTETGPCPAVPITPEDEVRYILPMDVEAGRDREMICRAMTGRQQRHLAGLLDKASKSASSLDSFDGLVEAARYCLRGWIGVADRQGNPVPYRPELVEDHLTWQAMQQLVQGCLYGMPTAEQVKNSRGRSTTSSS